MEVEAEAEFQIITPPVADIREPLAYGLVTLTEAIDKIDPELVAHGCLGGEHGYGANYQNDVFEMRPYYWGDCDCGFDQLEWEWCKNNKHADTCYQAELRRRRIATGMWEVKPGGDYEWWKDKAPYKKREAAEQKIFDDLCREFGMDRKSGAAVHCTCDYESKWKAWRAANGHKSTCTPELPNFLHKSTGLRVKWYKWIGRGMEVENAEAVDLQAVFNECLASLAHGKRQSTEERTTGTGIKVPNYFFLTLFLSLGFFPFLSSRSASSMNPAGS